MYSSTRDAGRPTPPKQLGCWISSKSSVCAPACQGRRQPCDQMPVVIQRVSWRVASTAVTCFVAMALYMARGGSRVC